MELIFLERQTKSGPRSKIRGALNNGGVINLSRACSETFKLDESFVYVRIALIKDQPETFCMVEETDVKSINGDVNVIKLTVDKKNGSRKFNWAGLLETFATDLRKAAEAGNKSIYFDIEEKQIQSYKVLQFTLCKN